MTGPGWRFVLVLPLLAIAGSCSPMRASPLSDGRVPSTADRIAEIGDLDRRVLGVFHRLVSSNVDVCPKRAFGAGWLLHAANQYSAPMRDMLVVDGLEGDLPAVSATAPGGPAATAGLVRGDVVMAVDGVELKAGATAERARYEGVEANLKVLEAALVDGGPLTLEIRREGVVREVVVVPEAVCAYDVHLDVSDELNARADGSSVHISSALARFALTDDELAVILGHELAHNVLEHRDILDREAPARRVFGNLAVAPGRLERVEREADRVGLFLMARANFAYEIAPAFWRRFGESNWRVRWAQWGHPSAAERARQLDVVVAEIRGTGLSGRSLTY